MKKKKRIENVRQHQYGIIASEDPGKYLATKGIWICTGWYGWDSKNKVAFLCHFDHPFTTLSVPRIIRTIRQNVPEDHYFESTLIGGKGWFWSRCTRKYIKDLVRLQSDLNISIHEERFHKCITDTVHVTIFPENGKVSFEALEKGKGRRKWWWFFRALRRSRLNA